MKYATTQRHVPYNTLKSELFRHPTGPDATVENHGSIYLVRLHSRAARDWVREHVEDTARYFGGALAVEPRYVADWVAGMTADGLEVS